MTIEQTRQLGIEFERRVQTMIPETEIVAKLDTETIYSYLNQYQDKLVHETYKALDGIPAQSKPSTYIEAILSGLITTANVQLYDGTNNRYSMNLPSNFGLYLSSVTNVNKMYQYKTSEDKLNGGSVTNVYLPQSVQLELNNRPYDSFRIIRNPIFQIKDNKAQLTCDRYTDPTDVDITYYRIPRYMDLMTSTPCELSMDAFDDLVTGAVDLYVQYVAGAEARKRQLAEAQQKQQKSNKDNEDE